MGRARTDERGIAMITSLLVMAVVTSLSMVAVQISLHSASGTATDRKRIQSIDAAEAGIDLAFSMLQSVPLPCSLSGNLGTGPTVASYTVTITYYGTYPVTSAPLSCVSGTGPAATPLSAEITSTGSTNATVAGKRTMDSFVVLHPVPSSSLDKAIFSNAAITINNKATVYGHSGNDAGVYTNGDFTCNNNQTINGSVYAQGKITGNNSCTATVDYYAKGNVTLNNSVTIGHDVKSSTGNITMNNAVTIGHDAIAHGTNSGGTVKNNRVSGATLSDPPSQTFPTVNFNSAAWTTAGYTRQLNDGSNCAQTYADINAMATQTIPTVIQTSCALVWNNNTTISLNASLAIFSTGGFTANNNFTVQSTNQTLRLFHLIVPMSATLVFPCLTSSPGITLNNNTTFSSTVNVFFYTPCTLTINNQDGGYGQIYGGVVNVNNNFTQHFVPIVVPGAVVSGPPSGYTIDIIYKREIANP